MNPHAAHLATVIGTTIGLIVGIFINTFFVWLALLIARLRAGFGGKLALSAASALPVNLLPLQWGWIVSLLAVIVTVQKVTDAEDWTDSLKYLGSSMLVSMVLLFLAMRLLLGTFSITTAMQKFNSIAEDAKSGAGPGGVKSNSSESQPMGEPVATRLPGRAQNYGLSDAEEAEIQRKLNMPIFKKENGP